MVYRSTPTTSNNSNLCASEQDAQAMAATMETAASTNNPIPRPPMTATILILFGLFYVFGIIFGYVSEMNDEINENKCDLESEFENVDSGDLCGEYDYPPPTTAPVNNSPARPPNCLKFIVIFLKYVFSNPIQGNENEIGLELEFKNVNCYFNFCDYNSSGSCRHHPHGYNYPRAKTTPTTASNNPTPFPSQPPQVILLVVEITCGILVECVFGNEINENENEIGLELKREFKKVNVDWNEYYDCSELSPTTPPSPAPKAAHGELFALVILHVNHVSNLCLYI